MVCKRSLYCWKNGPCASDQTRKQIWEENIRFRESLRDLNQSDHYWSFQISKNKCLCLEGEDSHWERPLSRKYRSASLQRLHDIDCASVTHDCNGLKFRNCYMHCPISKNMSTRADTPTPQPLSRRENSFSSLNCPFRPSHNSNDNKTEYCHRYKNTLLKSNLKPNMKSKCLSQVNLTSCNENNNYKKKKKLEKKLVHSSCEDISLNVKADEKDECHGKSEKEMTLIVKKPESTVELKKKSDCEVQTEIMKGQKLKPLVKFSPQEGRHTELSPLSRTTRKLLNENKKIPFVTYGCNNNNLDIGSKRTHNVLASKMEVYPNALLAKQKKKDWIMKYIQSEKEFQKKCFPEGLKRRINHSSLWSLDSESFNRKTQQKKNNNNNSNNKYLFPLMNKPLKKLNFSSNQNDLSHFKTYRKPQIYFY